MKFRYEYRTRDNVRHEDVIVARNREAVFSALAKRGIRPGRVEALPDPWRWVRISAVVIGVLGVALAVTLVVRDRASTAKPETRRQLYGDPVLIEKGVLSDWSEALADPIDRYLSRYAQPGWRVRVSTNGAERAAVAAVLALGDAGKVRYAPDDLMEFRQVKRIVAGLREEAAAFVNAGGSAERYLDLLDERQAKECEMVADFAKRFDERSNELEPDRLYALWLECNRQLKARGLKALPADEKFLKIAP